MVEEENTFTKQEKKNIGYLRMVFIITVLCYYIQNICYVLDKSLCFFMYLRRDSQY